MYEFAKILSLERKNSKFTQQQLADLLHVDHTLISQWERGICEPSLATLRLLCVILDITPDEILDLDIEQKRDEIRKQLNI